MSHTPLHPDYDAEVREETEGGAESFEQDGFKNVGSYATEYGGTGKDFTFDDLLPQVNIQHMNGVSVALNQGIQNGKVGTIHIRVIHDNQMRVYLFRKDEDGVSYFRVSAGLNVS
jgi:hypothetical protein